MSLPTGSSLTASSHTKGLQGSWPGKPAAAPATASRRGKPALSAVSQPGSCLPAVQVAFKHLSQACAPTFEDYFVCKASLSVYNTLQFVLSHLAPCLLRVGRWLEEERKATCFPVSSDKHTLSRAGRCLKVRSRASIHLLGSAVVYKAFAGSGLMLFDIVRPPSVNYCLVTNLTASIVLHLLIPYVLSSN